MMYLQRFNLIRPSVKIDDLVREHSQGFTEGPISLERVFGEIIDDTNKWYLDQNDPDTDPGWTSIVFRTN